MLYFFSDKSKLAYPCIIRGEGASSCFIPYREGFRTAFISSLPEVLSLFTQSELAKVVVRLAWLAGSGVGVVAATGASFIG